MSKKEKLEKDYQDFTVNIERMGEEEIKKISEKANAIKEDANKIGEAVAFSMNESESKTAGKKVNT
jgi:hypothetical protein